MFFIALIVYFLRLLISILDLTILAEVLFSYLPSLKESNFYGILVSINRPILEPFRRLQERFLGDFMMDLSPIAAILVLNILQAII